MNNDTIGSSTINVDPIVDDRTALYDQLEAQPYRLLQEEVTDLIKSTIEATGRDASDVETALTADPLDEDWWFSITTQQALKAIVVAAKEGVIRVNITYDLDGSRDLTVPSPDALPILDDGDPLTIYCLLDHESDLSATTGNVEIEGRVIDGDDEPEGGREPGDEGGPTPPTKGGESDQQTKTDDDDDDSAGSGPVTVTLIGPEGQQDSIEFARDRTMGFVVTELKQSYDVYDAEIGLYRDKRYSDDIDGSADPDPYDGESVYWQVEQRAA